MSGRISFSKQLIYTFSPSIVLKKKIYKQFKKKIFLLESVRVKFEHVTNDLHQIKMAAYFMLM